MTQKQFVQCKLAPALTAKLGSESSPLRLKLWYTIVDCYALLNTLSTFRCITISALYCFGEKFGKICTLRVCKERNHWLLRDAVQFLQCFALPVNSRSKVVLMRDHNNEDKRADHPLYRNHWLQPLGRRGDEYGMNHERNMCAKNGTRVSGAKKQ